MAHKTNVPYLNNSNIIPLVTQLYNELLNKYGNTLPFIKILIVGGSALSLKYSFRATVDIDADISFGGEIQSIINKIAVDNNIPNDWINQDFMKSNSYSRRLWENAIWYNLKYPPSNLFHVYVVNDLDQLCMKATAGRDKDKIDIRFLIEKLVMQGYTYQNYLNEFKYLYRGTVKENPKVQGLIKRIFKSYNAV